jgi:peptide/nickel transport system substrate-binding protein
MSKFTRRSLLQLAGSTILLPRVALAQSDSRPAITIAVQALTTSNTLDPVAEQSNVGSRILNTYVELLIGRNLQSQLEPFPQLATSWRRIDDKTLEVSLRQGVLFHNGDEMTAEDVAFTLGSEHMFGNTAPNGADLHPGG